MNKKLSNMIIIIVVLIIAILLIPIPYKLKDGGTVEYKALLYEVTKFHRINVNALSGYDEGLEIKILGIQVYSNFIATGPTIEANQVKNVSMTIKEGTLTNTGVTIIIENKNEKKHEYDENFRIDKRINNKWEEVKVINNNYVINDIAFIIGKDGIAEQKVDWKNLYGELGEGEYRIVKRLDGKQFSCIEAKFEIK